MTFYIIVKSLVWIPFVESSLWKFKKLCRRPFLKVFAHYEKYVSNATVLSSCSIVLFLCSNYFQWPFISSLKLFLDTIRRILVMGDSYDGSKAFSYSFCGLRKVDIQCYCAQLKFNRIVLVLKLLSMTFYIIVKSLVQIPFVESSLWRIQMLVRRPSLTVFADYANYVSNATVLSSSSMEIFLCSNYFQSPFISSLKLWLRYQSQKPRYGG